MLKKVFRRFTSLLLATMMVLSCISMFPRNIYAANLSTPDISGLTATYTNGTWTATGRTLKGSATAEVESGCGSTSYKAVTSTLTLKNSSGQVAQLSFTYPKPTIASGGQVTIDGTAVTAAGSFSKELAANETVIVTIKSSADTGNGTSSLQLDNVTMTVKKEVTVTFDLPVGNGTYTVNGTTVNSQQSITQLSTVPIALVASPASGYKLEGWYSVEKGEFINSSNSYTSYFDQNQTIYPVFIPSTSPVWSVDKQWYTDLNDAISYATSNNKSKITLVADGTLAAGTYTIPSGKTVLIPYNIEATVNTTLPERVLAGPSTPSAFRTLTLSSGANIVVNGSLCVNAQINGTNSSYSGVTTGKYGYIKANEGSSITLNNGSYLYCWGYISGLGEIYANSGSTVYEPFQICDLRGGNATSSMNNNSQKVLPFVQYYVQNIEAPLTIQYGASEVAVGSVYVASINVNEAPAITFIGSDSSSMFRLSSGTAFRRVYSPTEDRVYYDIQGSASLNSVSLNVGVAVNTANYILPLMENTTIRLSSGTTTVNQSVFLIPGCVISIDPGAVLNVASNRNVYVYDRDDFVGNGFVFSNTDMKTSYYQPDRANANKFTVAKMVDARIDVNGEITVNGTLFTTTGGADITSVGASGKVTFATAPAATGTTYQATQSSNQITGYPAIAVTAPKLHNGILGVTTDPEYKETAGSSAGTYFSYCALEDKWHTGDPCEASYILDHWTWT